MMKPVDISKYKGSRPIALAPLKPGTTAGTWVSINELLSRDISFGEGKFSDKKKQAFFFELSTLLQSGIDLKNSLDLITIGNSKDKTNAVIQAIKAKVILGESLSLAVQLSGNFPPTTILVFRLERKPETRQRSFRISVFFTIEKLNSSVRSSLR